MSARRTRFRTKLCRNFALGHCPQGDKCNYIHAPPDVIQTNNSAPMLQTSISQRSLDDQLSSTTFSPSIWPSLSPATNASSEQYTYHVNSTSSTTGVSSSRIKYRSLSWRTTLCRHFLKNRGWCPLGDECNYIHDLTLADFAKDDVRFSNRRSSSATGGKQGERGKAGSKHSHCWAYVQGLCHVQDCPYLHPVAIQLFAAHTPCLAWPNCRRGPLCAYKHPEPYISNSPVASPTQAPAKPLPPHPPPTQHDSIPRGAMQYNGVFYFSLPQSGAPSLPGPPLLQVPPPGPFQQPFMFANPWETWQMPYTSVARPQGYTPIAMNAPPPPAWPAITTFASPTASNHPPACPPQLLEPAGLPRPFVNYTYQPAEESPEPSAASVPDDSDLPYVPPKSQRNNAMGHARRISVTIKNKDDLDALGLDSSSHERLPWQTHAGRVGRRSWAPSSSRTAQNTPPPPPIMLYGV